MDATAARLIGQIQLALTPDLLLPKFQNGHHPLSGHCYVASEALFHALGGRTRGYKPETVRVGNVVHWYLRCPTGAVLDPTAAQFSGPVPYEQGRGRGFLTRTPSKRAVEVLLRITKRQDVPKPKPFRPSLRTIKKNPQAAV